MPVVAQFPHVGDLHLQAGSSRNEQKLRALDQIIRECLALPALAAWLMPGDLFHARSTVDDRNQLAVRLTAMAQRAPVVIVPGNHDAPGDLDIFARLKGSWPVIVQTTPAVIHVDCATGHEAAIACLPYPTRAGLVSAGVEKGDIVAEATPLLDTLFIQLAGELHAAAAEQAIPLFIGHANIAGSIASTGQPNIGHEIEIGPRHLDRLGAIYKGLNHIHKAQELAGAWYAGSACRLSWGEIEPKRYLVVDYEIRGGWQHTVRSLPLDVPAMWHVEGELTRGGFTWTATDGTAKVVDPPASWAGAHVRVRYRFKHSERSALATAPILALFAEAARLELEPVAVPDRELRAPAVATARTLGEKLAAYQQVEQLAPSVLAKLAALEHADPLATLTDVQNRLAAIEASKREAVAA